MYARFQEGQLFHLWRDNMRLKSSHVSTRNLQTFAQKVWNTQVIESTYKQITLSTL